jgi:2-keto-4-pentenoate hydratase/2-oxohepta-3-ene-1,7-dioic acid hydratase in catechol pathway
VRLVTYDGGPGTSERVGVLRGDDVVGMPFEGDMRGFIENGDLSIAEAALHSGTALPGARLRAPLRPRTLRDFLTFEQHSRQAMIALGRGSELPALWYEVPAYYKGLPDTVIGPGDEIPWPSYSNELDYELEIACVIGSPGRDISREDARSHIFGWTIWNDMSARDTQARELPLNMGPAKAKDWDGSNVLGPCIATPDELDGFDAEMILRVNGEERTRARSSAMHHTFGTLIEYASRDTTLRPGEVIGSGTAPGGAGIESGSFLSEGDIVEMEITGIGVLRNRVGPRPAQRPLVRQQRS